jgi:hypothetical protein
MAYPARVERFEDAEIYQAAQPEHISTPPVTNDGVSFMRGVLVATLLSLPLWGIAVVVAFRFLR